LTWIVHLRGAGNGRIQIPRHIIIVRPSRRDGRPLDLVLEWVIGPREQRGECSYQGRNGHQKLAYFRNSSVSQDNHLVLIIAVRPRKLPPAVSSLSALISTRVPRIETAVQDIRQFPETLCAVPSTGLPAGITTLELG
jgi:hypothetical protein